MALTEEQVRSYIRRLLLSRMRILYKHGFYGLLLMHMGYAVDETVLTAGTDGRRIVFGTEFMDSLSDQELDFVMMHEVLHLVFQHCVRRKGKDEELYNIAADIVVNSNILYENHMDLHSITLKKYGISMHLTPDGKEGYEYTAEQVYQMLEIQTSSGGEGDSEQRSKNGKNGMNKNGDKTNKGNKVNDGDKGDEGNKENKENKGNNDDKGNEGNKAKKGSKGDEGNKRNKGNKGNNGDKGNEGNKVNECGKGNVGNKGNKGNKTNIASNGNKISKDDKGESWDNHTKWNQASEDQQLQDEWKKYFLDACKAIEIREGSKRRGGLPMFAKRLLNELRKPQIDWRTLLLDFIQEEVVDYSFCPPDRRFDECPFFLPDFNDKDERVEDILFMIDTSGSMSDEMITVAFSEIKGAIDQFNGKLRGWLGFFDAAIIEPKLFEDIDMFQRIAVYGGGGTNFDIIFKYVSEKMEKKPVSIIILTDGYAPFPKEKQAEGIPVLWLINNQERTPDWGKIARIEI